MKTREELIEEFGASLKDGVITFKGDIDFNQALANLDELRKLQDENFTAPDPALDRVLTLALAMAQTLYSVDLTEERISLAAWSPCFYVVPINGVDPIRHGVDIGLFMDAADSSPKVV